MIKKNYWQAVFLTITFWLFVVAIYKANVYEARKDGLRQEQQEAVQRERDEYKSIVKEANNDVQEAAKIVKEWSAEYDKLQSSKQNMENTAEILMRKGSEGVCDEVVGTTTVNHSGQYIWKKNRAVFHPFGGFGAGQKCIGPNEYDFYVRCYDSRWETFWNKTKSKDVLAGLDSHLFFTPLKDVDLKLFACVEPEIPYADEKLQRANEMGKEIRIQ